MTSVTGKPMDSCHQADNLTAMALNGRSCQVSDISELLRHILQLQPHEELDITMTLEDSPAVCEPASHNGHRGYLMHIELGEFSTICVKRTF